MAIVPGSMLRCIDGKDVNLTKNNEYEAIGAVGWQVAVVNDHKQPQFYDAARFKVARAARDPDYYKGALKSAVDTTFDLAHAVRDYLANPDEAKLKVALDHAETMARIMRE
jgi:hypothetical protein